MGIIYDPGWETEFLFGERLQFEARPTRKIVGCCKDRTVIRVNGPSTGDAQSHRLITLFMDASNDLIHHATETRGDCISPAACVRRRLHNQTYLTARTHQPSLDACA